MCEGCEWLWNSGMMDESVGLNVEMHTLDIGSDNHAIVWALAKENTMRVGNQIHRVLTDEVMEELTKEPLMQVLVELLGEIL
tara:strand:- start:7138 stop:7383 length:246 start_codon:yes stop_codon:yes gene_type:complete